MRMTRKQARHWNPLKVIQNWSNLKFLRIFYYLCTFLPRGGLGRTRTAGRLAARAADLRGWLMKTEGGRERALRLPALVPSMVTGVLVLRQLLILPRCHRPVPPCAWSSAHGAFVLSHSAHAHIYVHFAFCMEHQWCDFWSSPIANFSWMHIYCSELQWFFAI